MLANLKRLLFAAPAADRHQDVSAGLPARDARQTSGQPQSGGIPWAPAQIDAAFYGLVLGVNSMVDGKLNGFESGVLRGLDQLLNSDVAHSELVPRLPAVIPRVLTVLRDDDSSAADLALELGRDAVLVSEVIRLSNSPYYRVSQEITSLERAVFILGRTGVRQLVAHAAFRPLLNLNTGHFSRLAGTLLWDQSERAAIASDCMAKNVHVDRFQAYLGAIVQNVGFTVSLQVLDKRFDGREAPNSQRFRREWVERARRLSLVIARQWNFPAPVLDALEAQADSRDLARLSTHDAILRAADRLAKVHMLASRGRMDVGAAPDIGLPHPRLSAHYADCYRLLSE